VTIIDAHHHVWDLATTAYPWMDHPRWDPIRRNYGTEDFRPALVACGIGATVMVQVGNDWKDCLYGLKVAERDPMIAGYVAWVDLADPARARAQLDELCTHPKVVGIRHVLTMEADLHWVMQPKALESIAEIGRRGLVYEVTSDHLEHLEYAATLARRFPDQRFVVNHLGKPPIPTAGWEPWAGLLAKAAACPNVYSKLSGLTTPPREGWSGHEYRRYVEYGVEQFGAARLMYGSNWPVTLVAGAYERLWEAMGIAMQGLSVVERKTILEEGAVSCYGLKLPAADAAGS
jgi:L-fuconolactonase